MIPKKVGGKISSMTRGLVKEHTVGFLVGSAARQRIKKAPNVFYGRFTPTTSIEDVFLRQMTKIGDRRILDFGNKSDKPVFSSESIR